MGDPVTAAAISTAVSTAVGTIQKNAQARAQQRAQQDALNRQIEQRRLEQQTREKQQREKLKQQQATARAAFGARGVSSAGGSANALIDGIAQQTEDAIADDRRLVDFGIDSLRANQRKPSGPDLLSTANSIFSVVSEAGVFDKKPEPSVFSVFGDGKHPGER